MVLPPNTEGGGARVTVITVNAQKLQMRELRAG